MHRHRFDLRLSLSIPFAWLAALALAGCASESPPQEPRDVSGDDGGGDGDSEVPTGDGPEVPRPTGVGPELEAGWNLSVVDDESIVSGTTSIVLDEADNPIIAYLDATNDDLKVASFDGASWTIETAAEGGLGWHSSLARGTEGDLHVAHYGFGIGHLLYTTRQDGVWQSEIVDQEVIGRKPSLALGADGFPQIAYHDTENDDLRYAVLQEGGWAIEIVDDGGAVGDHASLVIAPDQSAHVAYYRQKTQDESSIGDLLYARREAGSWTLEEVDVDGIVGWFTDIAIDGEGRPFISYRDESNGHLKVARRQGGAWSYETVDADGELGDFNTSIAVGADGYAVVSYHDAEAGVLKVARDSAQGWAIEIVDETTFSGHYSSVVLDGEGNPHVSYSWRNEMVYPGPAEHTWLKYARFVSEDAQ